MSAGLITLMEGAVKVMLLADLIFRGRNRVNKF